MNIRTLGTTLVTAAALSLATPSLARQADGGQGGQRSVEQLISINFDGGSLSEYVDALRTASADIPVNILFPPEFARLSLPPIQLEQINLYNALEIAAGLSQNRPSLMPDGREASWDVEIAGGGPGAPVFLISAWAYELDEEPNEDEQEEYFDRFTMVQSLAGLITGEHALGADAVLSSIQIALEMADQGDADLRFHEDTGLLFAQVTEKQHDAIEETVVRLMESASHMRRVHSRSEFSEFLELLQVESKEDAFQAVTEAREMANQVRMKQAQVADMRRAIESEQLARDRQAHRLEQEIATLQIELRQFRSVAEDLERQNQRLIDERETLRVEVEALRADRRSGE